MPSSFAIIVKANGRSRSQNAKSKACHKNGMTELNAGAKQTLGWVREISRQTQRNQHGGRSAERGH
jgi:hypothetical protein